MSFMSRKSKSSLFGYVFIFPALIGFLLFYAWPAGRAVGISLTDWNLLSEPYYVGLDNYAEMLEDDQFWNGIKLSAYYVLLNIPLQIMLGLFLAVAMDRLTKSLFVKAAILLPYLLSNVLVALVWLWMLDPILGIVNSLVSNIGLTPQAYLGDPDQALISVAAINIWRHMGLCAMLFLAGLQTIPKYLYESASLEGVTEFQMFRKITLPLLRPVMVFVLVTSVTGSFQIFDTIAVTTAGGPLDSTRVIVYYIVQNAFSFYKMGYASAMSVTLCMIMLAYTLLQMHIMRASESDLN
ncbi:MAG: sugar ABC transporter permease [Gammaproteobacteria bacterium]|jgi:multiple sugar transport system permease protein|nr:sugar ABC transporter permease [Gammaproteobacteria bacterium]MBU1468827.1 sugar ABC transporter permease [Gammaproteobacteria bacterium]MBU2024144.1 sugar ABC transporter permease [Gammaproteobacteria bacterium]MBU2239087.1 sugar ABC transporter permease [Gammaproteobacteria bacterium]MBU2317280.1 sugar ABC transporter permease [Gammaproteobacteria bacterium]